MWQRFFITVYFLLHIPLLVIPIYAVTENRFWEDLGMHDYKVKCLNNNQYVVLQGSLVDTPDIVSDQLLQGEFGIETKQNLRFYCAYYNEIQPHIQAYREAKTRDDQVRANKVFFQFQESKQPVFFENYQLEVVETKNNWAPFWNMLFEGVFGTLLYYALLQVARIIYTYIVLGKIVWHPYRFSLNKKVLYNDATRE